MLEEKYQKSENKQVYWNFKARKISSQLNNIPHKYILTYLGKYL